MKCILDKYYYQSNNEYGSTHSFIYADVQYVVLIALHVVVVQLGACFAT